MSLFGFFPPFPSSLAMLDVGWWCCCAFPFQRLPLILRETEIEKERNREINGLGKYSEKNSMGRKFGFQEKGTCMVRCRRVRRSLCLRQKWGDFLRSSNLIWKGGILSKQICSAACFFSWFPTNPLPPIDWYGISSLLRPIRRCCAFAGSGSGVGSKAP